MTTTITIDATTTEVLTGTTGGRLLLALDGDHKSRIKQALTLMVQGKCTSEESDLYVDAVNVEQDAIRNELAAEAAKVNAAKNNPRVAGISNAEFLAKAEAFDLTIGTKDVTCNPHQSAKSGSVGFYASGKTHIQVGGKLVECQIGLNITVIGSKTPTTK